MAVEYTLFKRGSILDGYPLMLAPDAPLKSTTSVAAAGTIAAYGNGSNRILIKFYGTADQTITWTKSGGTKVENIKSGEIIWRDIQDDETFTIG